MNVEIIAVGTELLLGQIVNTNAQFLSQRLATMGINVYYQTVVGDNAKRLESAIIHGMKRADLIICTGGLGPTEDDLTKEVVAKVIDKRLVYHEETLAKIRTYFEKIGRIMTENNKKQALLFENSIPLINDHGMAVGNIDTYKGCTFVLLPGPPKEMKPMFTSYVEPYLMKKLESESVIHSKMLRFFGIGESQLETEVIDLLQQINPTVAPLAADGEVALRLTAKGINEEACKQQIAKTEEIITDRVGKYLYGNDEDTLSSVLMEKLKKYNWKISFAESLTGGLCASTLTDLPGASDIIDGSIVTYSNEVKHRSLGVAKATLDKDGAVSEQCAREMAVGVAKLFQSNVGVGLTGVAGPSMSEGKEVGTVYIGISIEGEVDVLSLKLAGTREQVRMRAMKHAFSKVIKKLS
ncbi:MAG: competence/damage-inducible protein A [Bacillaceae bacterium]